MISDKYFHCNSAFIEEYYYYSIINRDAQLLILIYYDLKVTFIQIDLLMVILTIPKYVLC
jgi:hypothetical protein